MALKKSKLYSSLWSSCDERRGGMDASQYKDYVLVILFIKYVSDKYVGVPYVPITNRSCARFKDMVALMRVGLTEHERSRAANGHDYTEITHHPTTTAFSSRLTR
jgi:hypothetical protein